MTTTPTAAPVVVGVDDTPTARRAADRAAALALSLGAPLHLVMALSSNRSKIVDGPGSDSWVIEDNAVARGFLEDLALTWPDLEVSTATAKGKPSDVLISEAERLGAEVIVVGNRRMSGAGRILGAVANDIAHHAPCDVYVAHTNV